jgi:hypothetical protein
MELINIWSFLFHFYVKKKSFYGMDITTLYALELWVVGKKFHFNLATHSSPRTITLLPTVPEFSWLSMLLLYMCL